MHARLAALGAVTVVAIAVTGCTSDHGDNAATSSAANTSIVSSGAPVSSAASSSAAAKTSPPPSVYQTSLPAPSAIGNVVSKRKLVAMTGCTAAAGGGWSAKGTASNPTAKAVAYTVTVFFTTNKATVQDYAISKFTVAPGKTMPWVATKKFPAATPTLCVLRGVA